MENSLFSFRHSFYGISRDGSKNFNLRTYEHMILGQLRIWARQTTYAALSLPMSVTDWLSHELVEDWMNWLKCADQADYAE